MNLTRGSVIGKMLQFSVPYLIACFLQTFYGMADLFITGQYNGADVITAVSVGSQIMHMLTVVIVGLAMGATVTISHAVGAKEHKTVSKAVGNTVVVFSVFAAVFTALLLCATNGIIKILSVPEVSVAATRSYLLICFAGVPFITAYNVIAAIFRGMGDSRRPMYFVGIAGIINVGLDFYMIGILRMGAAGAAIATVAAQAFSVVIALIVLMKTKYSISLRKSDFHLAKQVSGRIVSVGLPIAFQEGLIQVSFIVITIIANRRGVDVAAAVGIVEKVICFMFLVPSAMLSTISAMVAQNAGAKLHDRGRKVLFYGMAIAVGTGAFFFLLSQVAAPQILQLFDDGDPEVIRLGAQYLRTYSVDCIFAAIHFCFSGYFTAYQKSIVSFLHNFASIIMFRIPGAYLASIWFPTSLYAMGLAAPTGSIFSGIVCLIYFLVFQKRLRKEAAGRGKMK